MKGKLSYKTLFNDGSISYSESFDPDNPELLDRYPIHTIDSFLGDRSPTPTQQREQHSERKPSRKKKNSVVSNT